MPLKRNYMNIENKLLIIGIIVSVILCNNHSAVTFKLTVQLVSDHQYPVEEHTVVTTDDYVLTIYRIPDSPKLHQYQHNYYLYSDNGLKCASNATITKPIVFLQHGLLSTSDDWIIVGPDNSLAYLFADMGYDVWLGNSRGNTYSRQHKYKPVNSMDSDFWNFSWHEVGIYDLTAMFDYVLNHTKQDSLHFIGHSQGSTAFLVLLTQLPSYNKKMKTIHLLAPAIFFRHHSSPLSKFLNIIFEYSTIYSMFSTGFELLPTTYLQKLLCKYLCSAVFPFRLICSSVLNLLGGWGSNHLNYTLLPHLCETHPAGASTKQIIHFVQSYRTGGFMQFDYGIEENLKKYQQSTPPHYNISNVNACIHIYYSGNDYITSVRDVEYLASLLPCVELIWIPYKNWNHYDFLWSVNVKEMINDPIINIIDKYESNKQ